MDVMTRLAQLMKKVDNHLGNKTDHTEIMDFIEAAVKEQLSTTEKELDKSNKYGCFVDFYTSKTKAIYDDCVFDEGCLDPLSDCTHASDLHEAGKTKQSCKHWRRIGEVK